MNGNCRVKVVELEHHGKDLRQLSGLRRWLMNMYSTVLDMVTNKLMLFMLYKRDQLRMLLLMRYGNLAEGKQSLKIIHT